MRYLCALLIVVALPLPASAQRRQPHPPPSTGLGTVGLPLPAIGLPPAPVKPWLGTQMLPSWERPRVPAWERQGPPAWERPRISQPIHPVKPGKPGKPGHDRRRRTDVVFVPYPAYGYNAGVPYSMGPAIVSAPVAAPAPPPPPSDIGYLRLEVEPAAQLQVYVDGVFIGMPADIGDELELRSGAHRVELRAPGHDPVTFDARIEAERGITYRATLRPIEPPAPPAPVVVPAGNRTLYVIPGCYLGNVPPDVARLPASCDISRMKTHAPQ